LMHVLQTMDGTKRQTDQTPRFKVWGKRLGGALGRPNKKFWTTTKEKGCRGVRAIILKA